MATTHGTLFDAADQFTHATAAYHSGSASLADTLRSQLSHRDSTRLDTYRCKLQSLTVRVPRDVVRPMLSRKF